MASDNQEEQTSSSPDNKHQAPDFSEFNLPTDLTAFQLHTLFVIARITPTEGVKIQEALEEIYPEPINHGRLYPGLDRLAEKGLITKQPKESDKRRNEYTITGRGEWVVAEYSQFVQEMHPRS